MNTYPKTKTVYLVRRYLAEHENAMALEIATAIGKSLKGVHGVLRYLRETGEIEPVRNATTWYPAIVRRTAKLRPVLDDPDLEPPQPTMPGARVVHFPVCWRGEPAQRCRIAIGPNNLGI